MTTDLGPTSVTRSAETFLEIAGCRLTTTALIMGRDLTYAEFAAIGHMLAVIEGAVQFWVGDWVNAGEAQFGERAQQAISDTGWSYDTVQQYSRVARQVAPERRHPGLVFSHHREVSDLMPEQQVKWLAMAAGDGPETRWSSHRLRETLRVVMAKETDPDVFWVLVACETYEDREEFREQMRRSGRKTRYPKTVEVR